MSGGTDLIGKALLNMFLIFTNKAEMLEKRFIMRSYAARHDTRAGPFLSVPICYIPSEVVENFATVQAHVRRRSISIRIRGRTIAEVLLPDGTTVNHALVKDGWCWWYRKYAPKDTAFTRGGSWR